MSYQKKSLILQQLQQAIRKKAQEKSRHKDQANRVLQSSIEKKKNTGKPTVKDSRGVPVYKPTETAVKPTRVSYQPLSLFNNEQLNTIEGGEFKFKKYNNRRLDKLVSLIQYMVSSSEKAVKYISSTNFQAEFALKLYRSDKDNLMNELKTLNVEDIVEQRGDKEADREVTSLTQQNTRLKKEILILEKEAQRWHQKGSNQFDFVAPKGCQREISKFQEMFRKLLPFETFKQVMDLLQREGKFEQMLTNPHENTKKITQIEMGIRTLQQERLRLIQTVFRMKDAKVQSRSDRTYRLSEIQEDKEHLQKEIYNLKQKLNQIKQSSKSIGDLQLLRKSSELVNQRLASLLTDLSKNGIGLQKKSNEQLIDLIRNISLNYKQMQEDLSSKVLQTSKQLQVLKRQNVQLRKSKRQNDQQFTVSEQKMQRMIGEMQQFKGVIEELSNDRDSALQQIKELQSVLRERDSKILSLNQLLDGLEGERQENQQWQSNYNEIKKQMQISIKKSEEKERLYRDKITKLQNGNHTLEDKVLEMAQDLERQRNQITTLIQQNDSGKSEITVSAIKQQFENRQKQQSRKLEELQKKIDGQMSKFTQLKSSYEETVDEVVRVSKLSSEKSNRIQQQDLLVQQLRQTIRGLQLQSKEVKVQRDDERIDELEGENASLRGEMSKMKAQNVSLLQKLRSTQNEIINNNYAVEELTILKKQAVILQGKIKELDAALVKASAKIDQCNQRNSSLQIQLQQEKKQFKQLEHQYQRKEATVRQNLQMVDELTEAVTKSSSQCQQFKDEKVRLQRELQQQLQSFTAKLQQLNSRVQAGQLVILSANQKNGELIRSLDAEKNKTASLTEKSESQYKQMIKLRQLTASFTSQIQKHVSQNNVSEDMIITLTEEKEQLSAELTATKQQIQDQIDLNHHKMQQYVNLLKQILKGFQIDSQELASKDTFEELLQFGSKQVVQMRKRLRDQESNRRKNSKKQQEDYPEYQHQSSGKKNVELQLEQCKVQLFSIDKAPSPIATGGDGKDLDLDEFNEFNNDDPMNNSIASQQNINANEFNIEEFADHEQKMNASMLSEKEAKLPIREIPNEGSVSKAFQNFKLTVTKDEPKIALKTEGERSNDKQQSPKSLGNTVSFPPRPNKPEISASNSNGAANFNLRNLDQFDEVKSDEMNESLVSQQMNRKKNVDDDDASQQLGSSLQKAINQGQDDMEDNRQGRPAKGNGNFILNSFGGNFFADPEDDDLDDSLQSDQERGLSDFEEVNNDRMGDSILSNKEGEHGFSEFGQVDCGMGDSIVSQQSKKAEKKQSGNSFSQFEQYKYGVGPMPSQKDKYGVASSRSKHF